MNILGRKPRWRDKKSKFYSTTCKFNFSEYDEWRASWLFYEEGPYHIFLSLLSLKIFVLIQLINVGTTTNYSYNEVVLQRSITNLKLSYRTYFWNKCCNLLFLAICRSQFPLLIFLASSWFQKAKATLRMSLQNKKIWLPF